MMPILTIVIVIVTVEDINIFVTNQILILTCFAISDVIADILTIVRITCFKP